MLFIGMMFTGMSILMAVFFYGDFAGTIRVNGKVVTQEEFNAMLWPKLFIALFFIVGLIFLFSSLKNLIIQIKLRILGKETYGRVTKVVRTSYSINGRTVFNAWVYVYVDGIKMEMCQASIGCDRFLYKIGQLVKVKYYKSNIKIIGKTDEESVPYDVKNRLERTDENYDFIQ